MTRLLIDTEKLKNIKFKKERARKEIKKKGQQSFRLEKSRD
jgi:hypothetical protein